jgi:tetratricopeptide (TPR) repeat protein
MIYNYLALAVIILSLAVVFSIMKKKYHQLKIMDVSTIAEEKEEQVKERILLERLKRRAHNSRKLVSAVVAPGGKVVGGWFSAMYRGLVNLEKKFQHEATHGANIKDATVEQKIKSIFQEALDFVKKDEYSEAEKKYIEIVSLDSQYRDAYKGLANIYARQKEYQQALQTVLHILKLDKKSSKTVTRDDSHGGHYKTVDNAEIINEDYLWIGELYTDMGDQAKAFEYYQKAIELTPNDPKTLDLLINSAIILRNKVLALEYSQKLSSVNPENQKLTEYKKRIEEL